jgi:DNA repair protein RadC
MATQLHDRHFRLMQLGVRALSDAELIALVVGRSLTWSLRSLLGETPQNLLEYRGLSPRAATRLVAAFELGRRALLAEDTRPVMHSPVALAEYARKHLLTLHREEVHVLCLNARNALLHHSRVAEGCVDQCAVDPREVFAAAVAMRASGIVVVHNHPSGDPEPSVSDVTLTRRLSEAGRVLGIRVVDHVVVGHTHCVSLLERGLMTPAPGLRSAAVQSP